MVKGQQSLLSSERVRRHHNSTPAYLMFQVIYYSPTDTQAFVAWDATRSAIWVVFRGTDPLSIKDWIDDLNVHNLPAHGCCCCVLQGTHKFITPVLLVGWFIALPQFFKTAKTEWKNCSDCHVHEVWATCRGAWLQKSHTVAHYPLHGHNHPHRVSMTPT